jgi:hypothetical protein
MATYRFNPPPQLRNDPSWTIVSLDEVAELLAAHAHAMARRHDFAIKSGIAQRPRRPRTSGAHCEIGPFASAWWLHRCIELAISRFATTSEGPDRETRR